MFPEEVNRKVMTGFNGETPECAKSFGRKFKNWAKKIADNNGWELLDCHLNYSTVSGFFKQDEKFIYFSYEIPRDVPIDIDEWGTGGVLFRTAKHERDYHGGMNHFCSLREFPNKVFRELEREFGRE